MHPHTPPHASPSPAASLPLSLHATLHSSVGTSPYAFLYTHHSSETQTHIQAQTQTQTQTHSETQSQTQTHFAHNASSHISTSPMRFIDTVSIAIGPEVQVTNRSSSPIARLHTPFGSPHLNDQFHLNHNHDEDHNHPHNHTHSSHTIHDHLHLSYPEARHSQLTQGKQSHDQQIDAYGADQEIHSADLAHNGRFMTSSYAATEIMHVGTGVQVSAMHQETSSQCNLTFPQSYESVEVDGGGDLDPQIHNSVAPLMRRRPRGTTCRRLYPLCNLGRYCTNMSLWCSMGCRLRRHCVRIVQDLILQQPQICNCNEKQQNPDDSQRNQSQTSTQSPIQAKEKDSHHNSNVEITQNAPINPDAPSDLPAKLPMAKAKGCPILFPICHRGFSCPNSQLWCRNSLQRTGCYWKGTCLCLGESVTNQHDEMESCANGTHVKTAFPEPLLCDCPPLEFPTKTQRLTKRSRLETATDANITEPTHPLRGDSDSEANE